VIVFYYYNSSRCQKIFFNAAGVVFAFFFLSDGHFLNGLLFLPDEDAFIDCTKKKN